MQAARDDSTFLTKNVIVYTFGNMEVRYSKSMEKKLKNVQKSFGSMSKRVQLLISILRVAENLEEVPTSPPARRHKLQNLENHWALDVSANWRMIIRGIDGTEPSAIEIVEVTSIEDYH